MRFASRVRSQAVTRLRRDQGVLADFIGEGHYVRHVRRVRALCAERQQALLEAASEEIGGAMQLAPDAAGLHMVGWLPRARERPSATAAALREGVDVAPLSRYSAMRTRAWRAAARLRGVR